MQFLERVALFSEDRRYRYLLRRVWDDKRPRALVIMLNPSVASEHVDDATIRSLYRLLNHFKYGSFEVVNLFGFVATNPEELADADHPQGERNYDITEAAIERSDIVICAWGAHQMAELRRADVYSTVKCRKPEVYCFGVTKKGYPKHPLYLKTGTEIEVYRGYRHPE